jgi:hypothetical protein
MLYNQGYRANVTTWGLVYALRVQKSGVDDVRTCDRLANFMLWDSQFLDLATRKVTTGARSLRTSSRVRKLSEMPD